MRQKIKSISLASIMVLSVMSSLLIASVSVSASTVVITEAIQIVDGGTSSDAQAAVGSDSSGNVHVVWTRNNLHLYYSMMSPRGRRSSMQPKSPIPGFTRFGTPISPLMNTTVSTLCGPTKPVNMPSCTRHSPWLLRWTAWLPVSMGPSRPSTTPSFHVVLVTATARP